MPEVLIALATGLTPPASARSRAAHPALAALWAAVAPLQLAVIALDDGRAAVGLRRVAAVPGRARLGHHHVHPLRLCPDGDLPVQVVRHGGTLEHIALVLG